VPSKRSSRRSIIYHECQYCSMQADIFRHILLAVYAFWSTWPVFVTFDGASKANYCKSTFLGVHLFWLSSKIYNNICTNVVGPINKLPKLSDVERSRLQPTKLQLYNTKITVQNGSWKLSRHAANNWIRDVICPTQNVVISIFFVFLSDCNCI